MYNNKNKSKRGLFLLAFSMLFLQTISFAQISSNNSPYSRYGLGDLHRNEFSHLGAMGGIGAAYNSPINVNMQNPASYSFLSATAFDVGIFAKYSHLEDKEQKDDVYNGNLSYLSVAFPLENPISRKNKRKKSDFRAGMNLALLPFSDVAYNIETQQQLDSIGEATFNYQGSGGYYKFNWGTGVRYKGLAVGVNLGYIFGKASYQRNVTLNDLTFSFQDVLFDDISLSGIQWNFGAQYEINLSDVLNKETSKGKRTYMTIGVFGNPKNRIRSNTSQDYYRAIPGVNNSRDSISNFENVKKRLILPAEFGAGITIARDLAWKVGISYEMARWSQFEHPTLNTTTDDTWRLALGGEYTPNWRAINSYGKRITYRLGAFYELDPRVVEGQQLKKYALTMGMGFPLKIERRQSTSFFNLGFEVGRQGHPDILESTYVKATLGFTLSDRTWFYKQKFD